MREVVTLIDRKIIIMLEAIILVAQFVKNISELALLILNHN